MHITKVCR